MGKEKKKIKKEEEKKKQLQALSSPVQRQLLLQVLISFQKFPMHIQVEIRMCYVQCSATKFFSFNNISWRNLHMRTYKPPQFFLTATVFQLWMHHHLDNEPLEYLSKIQILILYIRLDQNLQA